MRTGAKKMERRPISSSLISSSREVFSSSRQFSDFPNPKNITTTEFENFLDQWFLAIDVYSDVKPGTLSFPNQVLQIYNYTLIYQDGVGYTLVKFRCKSVVKKWKTVIWLARSVRSTQV